MYIFVLLLPIVEKNSTKNHPTDQPTLTLQTNNKNHSESIVSTLIPSSILGGRRDTYRMSKFDTKERRISEK